MSDFIAETTDDFSHDHFELLNLILVQKLKILEAFLYFSFFITEVSNIIAETNHDFSPDHFEL